MVHGDKRKFLSALITLNPESSVKWGAEHGVPAGVPLYSDPRLHARIQKTIDELNARQPSYCTIKKFVVLPGDFTQDSGELTPTLKLKRKVVTRNNQALLDSLYVE
jgi:long-chain acyl-CoA synthetase